MSTFFINRAEFNDSNNLISDSFEDGDTTSVTVNINGNVGRVNAMSLLTRNTTGYTLGNFEIDADFTMLARKSSSFKDLLQNWNLDANVSMTLYVNVITNINNIIIDNFITLNGVVPTNAALSLAGQTTELTTAYSCFAVGYTSG